MKYILCVQLQSLSYPMIKLFLLYQPVLVDFHMIYSHLIKKGADWEYVWSFHTIPIIYLPIKNNKYYENSKNS